MSEYDPQLHLRQAIGQSLDHPSLYMGGASQQSLRKAERIIEVLRNDPRLLDALIPKEPPTVPDPHANP